MAQETANYPGSYDTLVDQEAKKDPADKSIINRIQNILEAIEVTLGLNPQQSETTLLAWLQRCHNANGGMRKGTAFPTSPTPVEGDFFYRTDLDLAYIYDGANWDGFGDPADASISQAKLKTTTGEVGPVQTYPDAGYWFIGKNASPVSYTTNIRIENSGGSGSNLTLPGGEYGFYPQIKLVGAYMSNQCYAQQRYVQSSGRDPWIFLLIDDHGKIQGGWYAPDHPSYGQGGDHIEIPHPFVDYWGTPLPGGWEIVLVDAKHMGELRAKQIYKRNLLGNIPDENRKRLAPKKKSLLEIIVGEYEVNGSKQGLYVPRDIADYEGNHILVDDVAPGVVVRELQLKSI